LLDDQPGNSRETVGDRSYGVHQLRFSVAHDLEELLNTHREALDEPPPQFEEVNKSLIVYGLPDFTSYNMLDPGDANRVKRSLEAAIARFEPRLERVRVTMHQPERNDRSLRFKIEAMLRIEEDREQVEFDTVLELATQEYSVRGRG
jgi:type VI secretion system protein ImpF